MKKTCLFIPVVFVICACTHEDTSSLPDVSTVRFDVEFTCSHEADRLPPLDFDADKLFQYGRYLEKKDGPKDFNEVARYYRIAAAYGHYKANHNLQILISSGSAASPDPEKESVGLAEALVKAAVPSGYYDMGHYLLSGYGLKQDEDAARRYLRIAADLGNADAQYYIADLLDPADMAPEIAHQMFECAADQGHQEAASYLGIGFQDNAKYAEALTAFQKATAAGSTKGAFSLEMGFLTKSNHGGLSYLGVAPDPERARRYNLIGKFIDSNDGRNPKVPDIDKIVPLPPDKLPPWDGTFQWQKEQDAAIPPQKPSNDLIEQLARSTHLDPATGLQFAGKATKK